MFSISQHHEKRWDPPTPYAWRNYWTVPSLEFKAWVGIFQVGISWVGVSREGIFQRGIWWVGIFRVEIFQVGIFLEPEETFIQVKGIKHWFYSNLIKKFVYWLRSALIVSHYEPYRVQKQSFADVLRNFAIFVGKHLCWSLFLIKLQACEISKNSFFIEHLWWQLLRVAVLKSICEFSGNGLFYKAIILLRPFQCLKKGVWHEYPHGTFYMVLFF